MEKGNIKYKIFWVPRGYMSHAKIKDDDIPVIVLNNNLSLPKVVVISTKLLDEILKILERTHDFESIKTLIEEKERRHLTWKPNSILVQYQEAYEVYQQLLMKKE